MHYLKTVLCALLVSVPAFAAETSEWPATLEKIASGVVSIRVDGTRAFDTDWNQSTQATGFVVDAERGIILTNRHVVTPGPVVAEAVFLNHEEVELLPVYRDPVHDFGFFRFDPAALRYIEPYEFALHPEGVEVGREIRVVGNDAGEQLSILAGTLAKLDRRAPEYGPNKYNDFNTFYLQAASSTSGGSSGSPVIDITGRVIALNAGANTGAASSFFLPLDRVQRALRLIQNGKPVARGTLQSVFNHLPYDELVRLGLQDETQALVRREFPQQTGMLVAGQVVPEGPASGAIEPGDVLIGVNGQLITEFVPLEALLDSHVGDAVTVDLERGGQPITRQVTVQDLHSITPDEYIMFGSGIVHQLSYQLARHFNMPPEGIFVANPGYTLAIGAIPRGAVIVEVDGVPMRTLDDLEEVLAGLADGDRTAIRYYTFEDPKRTELRVVRMDRRWFAASRCRRDDSQGYWPCQPLDDSAESTPATPGSTRFATNGDPRVRKLAPSLVMVNFHMPYAVSGISESHYHGTGLIADAERGYVIVDRNTVPVAIGDVRLTFAGSLEVPGQVEFIHPLHNLAVVSYDPALILDTPVRSIEFEPRPMHPGDEVWVVGLKGDHRITAQKTEVASIDAVAFPLTRSFRFRDTNLETIEVVNAPVGVDGVLVDKRGRVLSLWSSFAYQSGQGVDQMNKGVPAELAIELIDIVRTQRLVRSLEVELYPVPLSAARKLGLPDDEVRRLEEHDPKRRQILQVKRLVAGSPAAELLRTGDLFLTVEGEPVNEFRDVERAVQQDEVALTVWRDNGKLELEVATVALDGQGIDRLVMWAGALLQKPHRALAAQRGIPPEGVYVAYFGYGTPATRYGMWAGRRILEVDGQPVRNLDEFVELTAGRGDRESVRLKTVLWNNAVEVITLKLDLKYHPTYELRLTDEGWQRRDLDGPQIALVPPES